MRILGVEYTNITIDLELELLWNNNSNFSEGTQYLISNIAELEKCKYLAVFKNPLDKKWYKTKLVKSVYFFDGWFILTEVTLLVSHIEIILEL